MQISQSYSLLTEANFVGATNVHDSRIIVKTPYGLKTLKHTYSWNHSLNSDENYKAAFEEAYKKWFSTENPYLLERKYIMAPTNKGYVLVHLPRV